MEAGNGSESFDTRRTRSHVRRGNFGGRASGVREFPAKIAGVRIDRPREATKRREKGQTSVVCLSKPTSSLLLSSDFTVVSTK